MKKGVSVGFILAGVYWIVMSFSYGLWVMNGPGGGFMPLIGGILAVIFGIAVLIEAIKEGTSPSFDFKVLIPVGALLAVIILSKLIGLILSIAVYLFIWLKFYEKESTKLTILVTILCPLACYLIFVMWLKAPLPRGILGIL
ncbi:MAG: tripartite tricarboxylate transporter TctB family protein [Epulopiscium sp.]|nr:tripartite tricarboxylate transporter TctB family protein [Candidatus Epulonipiscium sp.]